MSHCNTDNFNCFKLTNLWLNALIEGQVYPWVHLSLPTPLSRILSFLRSRDHASNLVVFAMCFQVPDLFVVKYGVYRAYFVYFKPRGHTVR